MAWVKVFNDRGIWKDISLSIEEEVEVESSEWNLHDTIMRECLTDATKILRSKEVEVTPMTTINLAVALFDKRASHVQYGREAKAREKFETMCGLKKDEMKYKPGDIKGTVPDIEPKDSELERMINKVRG